MILKVWSISGFCQISLVTLFLKVLISFLELLASYSTFLEVKSVIMKKIQKNLYVNFPICAYKNQPFLSFIAVTWCEGGQNH